ncbi:glutamate--tRNA ligase [Sphingomicrobium lutaoense]|uniref:Glutamate--tRNA ligase n=1 Tax=Sphingomicrobium lutaoense TaxID=515949 RepID=A0A839YXA9_9SPHN|nr:glutamate--tRNA ligase [Sphingomicrobium lutaoense]MBB3764831.1 glutamyl-tRNA synthetase [Sphingomicrobium lutaoense]
MKTRFAPAPTGRLHVGNIRTALHNYLLARREGGTFLLRIDDTDRERSREEYVEAIGEDLRWLGLEPDETARQSQRFDRYEEAFEKLRAAGRIYACYETPEELELRRKVLLGRGLPPVYERKDQDAPVPEGRDPHWRFRLDHDAPIEWEDRIRGVQKFDPRLISDPVVRRADGSWLYMLPSVVDDMDLGITHVVRGEDHVTNSAIQLQMFDALGARRPVLAHEALLVAAEGKLSKRLGSVGVEEMKARGLEPMALLSLLARIGTSQPVEPMDDLDRLAQGLDFAHFGRAPAHFDMAEVEALNAKLLHAASYEEVADRLPDEIGEAHWQALRGNIAHLAEAADYVPIFTGEIDAPEPSEEDRTFLETAANLAEGLPFDDGIWSALTAALKEETGRRGKALFLPLRLALTGRSSGPEMAAMLPLIGKERAVRRLLRR